MKKKILILLVTISLASLLVIRGQKTKEKDRPDTSQFPTIEYSNRKLDQSEKRKKKDKKYNVKHMPPITELLDQKSITTDWELNLPALPVGKSVAVIIGEVIDAQAHLSEDDTSLYSEFKVRINKTLKNEGAPLAETIEVERLGGRVQFPSGKVVAAVSTHQNMPQVGKRYLFFLIHEFVGDEDLTILTGYELRNGVVFPLDKPGEGHPIWSYKGVSEASLLNDLNSALANSFSQ